MARPPPRSDALKSHLCLLISLIYCRLLHHFGSTVSQMCDAQDMAANSPAAGKVNAAWRGANGSAAAHLVTKKTDRSSMYRPSMRCGFGLTWRSKAPARPAWSARAEADNRCLT
jgi:hypothetical protein